MITHRRDFLKNACRICMAGAVVASVSDLLSSCGTTMKGFKTAVDNNKVLVPLSLFDTVSFQVISPKNYDYEIAVQKRPDNSFQAILMRCTHHDNQLVPTGKGFYCSLHGSQFDKEGNVKKGPAERKLLQLSTEIIQSNLIIHV